MSKPTKSRETKAVVAHGLGPADEVNAIIGEGVAFEGRLLFEGTVHIHGQFNGELRSRDTLVVGEGGKVTGDILVGALVCSGEMDGTIRAVRSIHLHPPAHVRGVVLAPILEIEPGAIFEGQTQMDPAAAKTTPKAPAHPPRPTGETT